MNHLSRINRIVLAVLLVSASVSAFAGGGGGPRGSQPALHQASAGMIASAVPSNYAAAGEVSANTASNADTPTASAAGSAAQGKTRAQVYAELVQAERAGFVPSGNADYPPRPVTIERNLMRFKLAESIARSAVQSVPSGQ